MPVAPRLEVLFPCCARQRRERVALPPLSTGNLAVNGIYTVIICPYGTGSPAITLPHKITFTK